MDKPNCKICGVRHYVYEPHDFGPAKEKPKPKGKPGVPVNTNVNTKSNVERQLKWRASHREEFNRKRREQYKAKHAK